MAAIPYAPAAPPTYQRGIGAPGGRAPRYGAGRPEDFPKKKHPILGAGALMVTEALTGLHQMGGLAGALAPRIGSVLPPGVPVPPPIQAQLRTLEQNREPTGRSFGEDFVAAQELLPFGPEAVELQRDAEVYATEQGLGGLGKFVASLLAPDPLGPFAKVAGGGLKLAGALPLITRSARASPAAPYRDLPVIDPGDIAGATVSKTSADLLDAGRDYRGIDSSLIAEPEPLLGGPGYPSMEDVKEAGLVWGDTRGSALRKMADDSDFIAVTAMNPSSHASNLSFQNALRKTTVAYARDGRITPENLSKLDDLVRSRDSALASFPGFASPEAEAFMAPGNLSFEARGKISEALSLSKAQDLGAPNVKKILNATVDRQFAGMNPRDTLLLLEPDRSLPPLKLGPGPDPNIPFGPHLGLPADTSYGYGIPGRVVGRYGSPVSMQNQFPDFWEARRAGGRPPGSDLRSFDLGDVTQEMRPDVIDRIRRGIAPPGIEQPRQAIVLYDALHDTWRTTRTPVGEGGVSPQGFVDAIEVSPSSASLTHYTQKQVREGGRTGDLVVHQLGDNQVFFGIDSKPDYTWAGVDVAPGDKALVGVVSNELGAPGVASPAILTKALEEGVTILDAYAVKSSRFPDGFLPEVYGDYGFEVVERVPFDRSYFVSEHGERALADLIENWKTEGADLSQGLPDVVVMRYRGSENARKGATRRFFSEGGFDPGTGTPGRPTAAARESLGQGANADPGTPGRGRLEGSPGRDPGGLREDHRGGLSDKPRAAARGLLDLTPEQAENLGIDFEGLSALRGGLR